MKRNPKIFLGVTVFALLMILTAALAAGEELSDRERLGLELQVELNRLGSSGDPTEREALLRRIAGECQGTEAAEAAYWSLSDLYLDAFASPEVAKACEVLELFLKQYPDSHWTDQAKCRLLALYDGKDSRAAQIKRELLADGGLPQGVKGFLKDGAATPRLVLPATPKKAVEPKPAAPKKTVRTPAAPKKGSTPKKAPAKKTVPAKKSTKAPVKKDTPQKKR